MNPQHSLMNETNKRLGAAGSRRINVNIGIELSLGKKLSYLSKRGHIQRELVFKNNNIGFVLHRGVLPMIYLNGESLTCCT